MSVSCVAGTRTFMTFGVDKLSKETSPDTTTFFRMPFNGRSVCSGMLRGMQHLHGPQSHPCLNDVKSNWEDTIAEKFIDVAPRKAGVFQIFSEVLLRLFREVGPLCHIFLGYN